MILLVLITAGWTYVVIRLIRSRSAAAAVASAPVHSTPMQPVAWGRLDDMQLTRLLRDAARGK
jgi:hypothetical protein